MLMRLGANSTSHTRRVLPDNEHALEVLWFAFCRRLEQDCAPTGVLFDIEFQ